MDNQFLNQVASLFAKEGDLQEYTFVFPNRRSSLFFRKYLGELKETPMFAPRIRTISDVFEELSDKEVLSHIPLMMRLWKVWCVEQKKAQMAAGIPEKDVKLETADDFFLWGHTILSDFNDVDQYLVDAKQLFRNIKEYGDIRTDYSFLTEEQILAMERLVGKGFSNKLVKKRYFDMWNMLLPVYESFRNSLAADEKAYPAMQSRIVAEAIKRIDNMSGEEGDREVADKLDRMGKAVFIGFSAPTECDKVLMRHFKDSNGFGLFYWDYYSSMVRERQNRASHLISKCVEEFKCSRPLKDTTGGVAESDGKTTCSFTVIPASGQSEQAMIASYLLKDILKDSANPLDNAIVVADKTQILPLMGVIGEDVPLNITMGYPFSASSAASLVNLLIDFLTDLGTRGTRKDGRVFVSGELLRNLLNHSYIRNLNSDQAAKASDNILRGNMIRIESGILLGDNPLDIDSPVLKEFFSLLIPKDKHLFSSVEAEKDSLLKAVVSYFRNIVEFLSKSLPSRERCFLNLFHDALDGLYSSGAEFTQLRTVCSILKNCMKSASVPFSGEPLEGVQIMGTLETRCLDFENIIILSFNDGIFPDSGEQTSSIPYFLRKGFGLPTYEEQDSVSAYNFYRLIQRARKVYLLFDSNTEDLKTKEESRFIKQLIYDFRLRPLYRNYKFPLSSPAIASVENLKAEEKDLDALRCLFPDLAGNRKEKYLSSSSLNAYLDCQRKFFLANALEAEKDAEITDTVEAGNFGDIYHWCMQGIYDRYLKKTPTDKSREITVDRSLMEEIKQRVKDDNYLDDLIGRAFLAKMKVRSIDGENIIIRESVKKFIRNTISADYERASVQPFTLCDNEHIVKDVLFSSNIKGYVDRLEMQGKMPRICDYKTGKFVQVRKSSIAEDLKKAGFVLKPLGTLQSPVLEYSDEDFENALDLVFSTDKREKFFTILLQQLLYALMVSYEMNYSDSVEIAVYQLSFVEGFGPVRIVVSRSQLEKFESRLKDLVIQIKNKIDGTEEPVFGVCSDTAICSNCDFMNYCKRIKENE